MYCVNMFLLMIIEFCSGKTDYNNNKIPDSEEALGKLKTYLEIDKDDVKIKVDVKKKTKRCKYIIIST